MGTPLWYCEDCVGFHLTVRPYRCHLALAEEKREELDFRESGEPPVMLFGISSVVDPDTFIKGFLAADKELAEMFGGDLFRPAPERNPKAAKDLLIESLRERLQRSQAKVERMKARMKDGHDILNSYGTKGGSLSDRINRLAMALVRDRKPVGAEVEELTRQLGRSRTDGAAMRDRHQAAHDKLTSLGIVGRGLSVPERIDMLAAKCGRSPEAPVSSSGVEVTKDNFERLEGLMAMINEPEDFDAVDEFEACFNALDAMKLAIPSLSIDTGDEARRANADAQLLRRLNKLLVPQRAPRHKKRRRKRRKPRGVRQAPLKVLRANQARKERQEAPLQHRRY